MAIVEENRPVLPVPYAMDLADRAPKQRYYDEEFFHLEGDQLWDRVWQMACRLEEIPQPFDFTTYEILGQSIILIRTPDGGVDALQNTCRHRGVRLAVGQGACETGFTCPFHGWCYGPDGANTFVTKAGSFSEHNLAAGELDLTPVRCETWGGCAWINLSTDAPPLRECIEPFATTLDAWKLESMRAEWWYSFRLPVNWKLAESAFLEQYHVIQAHPQLVDADRFVPKDRSAFDSRRWLAAELRYLNTMSEGMAGMVHADDVSVAESLATSTGDDDLPADPTGAMAHWQRTLNDAVVQWHRERSHDIPDLNQLEADGLNQPMGYCFPHFFVLPMYSSASSYRFRPLGPEETLMEIWSLTRYPPDEERPRPVPPEPLESDDPNVPPIPTQDFANLPRQQQGLHNPGFEYMRFSEGIEGGVANFERTVDGFLAGLSYDELLPALHTINVNPLEMPIEDLGF